MGNNPVAAAGSNPDAGGMPLSGKRIKVEERRRERQMFQSNVRSASLHCAYCGSKKVLYNIILGWVILRSIS